ncbi:hypothetical protein L211DRAFT_269078 [Terfezia boudieri ATCC MYA-4762]|uniref:Uncharacterized protein n=1 Tax=Terfezia boudieri ATCC MYA-4762 TaxID=1051890 RepID=A0A3N4LKM4_9PEZI|nr:hypothetical protein L211DRAFT_269078 [Terfezia boudieri ATCC MYA-4762]
MSTVVSKISGTESFCKVAALVYYTPSAYCRKIIGKFTGREEAQELRFYCSSRAIRKPEVSLSHTYTVIRVVIEALEARELCCLKNNRSSIAAFIGVYMEVLPDRGQGREISEQDRLERGKQRQSLF